MIKSISCDLLIRLFSKKFEILTISTIWTFLIFLISTLLLTFFSFFKYDLITIFRKLIDLYKKSILHVLFLIFKNLKKSINFFEWLIDFFILKFLNLMINYINKLLLICFDYLTHCWFIFQFFNFDFVHCFFDCFRALINNKQK